MSKSNRGKVKTGLSSLARLVTGKVTATNAVGVADGVFSLVTTGKEAIYAKRAKNWPSLPIERRAGSLVLSLLEVDEDHFETHEWLQITFRGTKVLIRSEGRNKGYSFWSETSPKEIVEALRDTLWKRGEVLTLGKSPQNKMTLVPSFDDLTIIDSDPRKLHWSKLEPLLKAGDHRKILFHGSIGVGKKTLAIALASCALDLLESKGKILLVPKLESTGETTVGPLKDLIDLAKPSVLIFADVDQARKSTVITDLVNQFGGETPLIIVTTNITSMSKIPESFRVPGQFDAILPIVSLGTEFSMKFLGDKLWTVMDEVQRSVTSRWPVAYLAELKRQVTRGSSDLGETIQDLQARLS